MKFILLFYLNTLVVNCSKSIIIEFSIVNSSTIVIESPQLGLFN